MGVKIMNDKTGYFDISPEISQSLAVWPGDEKYRRLVNIDFKDGGNLLLSSIQTTVHLGAHTDAPNHYDPEGEGIGERKLDYYLGPCQVITALKPRGSRILPEDLGPVKILAQRVLIKTKSFPDPNQWNADFNSLSAELIEYLAERGVILVGIDTPSIDLFDDKLLLSHKAVYARDLAILEGVILDEVPDGTYTLVALPLRLKDADASPVRAILLKNDEINKE
ncbi:MAG: cyclase family protein [Bdellovibrionia bacterium]